MSWTDHPEDEARCPNCLGSIADHEDIARLLHSAINEPRKKALTTKELFGTNLTIISNTCGLSDGVSIDRCSKLSDDEIRSRATKQAAMKPGRQSCGAMVASVGRLRNIEVAGLSAPLVCAYDDPKEDNHQHGVIRAIRAPASIPLTRAEQSAVRDRILEVFDRAISA